MLNGWTGWTTGEAKRRRGCALGRQVRPADRRRNLRQARLGHFSYLICSRRSSPSHVSYPTLTLAPEDRLPAEATLRCRYPLHHQCRQSYLPVVLVRCRFSYYYYFFFLYPSSFLPPIPILHFSWVLRLSFSTPSNSSFSFSPLPRSLLPAFLFRLVIFPPQGSVLHSRPLVRLIPPLPVSLSSDTQAPSNSTPRTSRPDVFLSPPNCNKTEFPFSLLVIARAPSQI